MKLKREDIQSIVGKIEAKRLSMGLNYSELARISGVNQSQVSRICHGQFKTSSANVMQICISLGIESRPRTERADAARLRKAVMEIWDGTAADADRIARLLGAVGEIRRPLKRTRKPI